MLSLLEFRDVMATCRTARHTKDDQAESIDSKVVSRMLHGNDVTFMNSEWSNLRVKLRTAVASTHLTVRSAGVCREQMPLRSLDQLVTRSKTRPNRLMPAVQIGWGTG